MRKQLRNLRLRASLVLILVAPIFSTIGSLVVQDVARAWCDNISLQNGAGGYDNVCVAKNWDGLPLSVREKVPLPAYKKMAQSCMDGNAYGKDYEIREGGCADAAATCLAKAIDSKYCTGDMLATMVSTSALGDPDAWCNEGKLTGNGNDNCSPLVKANQAAFDDARTVAANKAVEGAGCTVPKDGSAESEQNARDSCAHVVDGCNQPELNDNGTLKNGNGYTDYEKCLTEALRTTAKDASECSARIGGIYLDKDTVDPDTSLPDDKRNKLSKGCYTQATDLTNPEACALGAKAAGRAFKWEQKQGQTAWTCVDPENPDGVDANKDPNAQCLKDAKGACIGNVLAGGSETCGEAKTNIIACDGQGATALTGVLRIFVIVLSFGVGIAAVASIAYSAIRYAGARDNQSDVSLARERIRNTVIGLLLYGFLIAIANWLVPGGIL